LWADTRRVGMRLSKAMAWHSACALLLALGYSQEQAGKKPEPQKGPSFTTAVYTVLVDVIATSKDKHVNDLRAEEFELFEDGEKQTIDSVEIQTESGIQVIKTPDLALKGQQAAPPAHRANIITFLLDYTTTEFQNQQYVRDGAINYIQEKVGPNDLVAIFATGAGGSLRALQGFTSDKALLMASLSKGDVSGSGYRAERSLLNSQIGNLRRAGDAGPSLGGGAAGGSGHTPAAAAGAAASGSAQAAVMMAQRIENAFVAMRSFIDSQLARPILTAIKSIALAEKEIPGRKTLILFSEGFLVPPNVENVLRDAVDAANKANLAIYTVDTQGLYTKERGTGGELESINAVVGRRRTGVTAGESLFDRARQVGSDQDESTLRFIANSTGGFLIRNTNDFQIGLQKIDDDIRTYYLLSYRPSNREFDGKFREIKVEVTRPGVKIRARNGYYAHPPSDTLLTPQQREIFAVARQRRLPAAIPLYVETHSFFPGPDAPVATVTIELSTDALKFNENATAGFEDSLQIVGLITNSHGSAVTTFGRPLPLQFSKAELEAIRGGFIAHSESVILERGQYTLEVLVQEPSSGSYGFFTEELSLEPPTEFRLSKLILSRQIVKALPEEKSDPLVTGEAKIVPSASRQFQVGERLIFYFDIYNATAIESRSNVRVTLSMEKDSQPLAAKLPSYEIVQSLKPGTERIQVSKYLELAGLPPGKYSLTVTAKDQNGKVSSSSESSFTLVR